MEEYGLPQKSDDIKSYDFNELQEYPSIHLEIGFGDGLRLAEQAAQTPEALFIGAEIFLNGVAQCSRKIQEKGIENIRLFHGVAQDLMEALPDESLDSIYLLFPDPWPKKKHTSRRFLQIERLAEFHRLLKPSSSGGGRLIFASDNHEYVNWTLERVLSTDYFSWPQTRQADWTTPPPDWISTKYEKKLNNHGEEAAYFEFLKT